MPSIIERSDPEGKSDSVLWKNHMTGDENAIKPYCTKPPGWYVWSEERQGLFLEDMEIILGCKCESIWVDNLSERWTHILE